MARRATYFDTLRSSKNATPLLLIAGPYEFVSQEDGAKIPDRKILGLMTQAFALLDYQVGYLSPEEASLFRQDNVQAPKGWQLPPANPSAPATQVVTVNGARVGVVYFPFLPGDEAPPKEAMDAVLDAAAKLRQEVNLVVGVSPWGYKAEQALTTTREKDLGAFDILLGGGLGAGAKGHLIGDKTLWVRPYSRGKAVNVVTVSDLPAKNSKLSWKENDNITFDIAALKDDISPEPKVDSLFEGLHN